MKNILFVLVTLFLSTNILAETGLEKGNNRVANFIRGEISIQCPNERRMMNCYGSYLDKGDFDYFSWDSGALADKVTLVAKNEEGKEVKKSSKLKGSRSKKSFNLWINTLLQRSLLDLGTNEISYTLEKKNQTVEEGSFTVTVERAPTRTCRYRHYYSSNDSDCSASTTVCSQYFREQNYCR